VTGTRIAYDSESFPCRAPKKTGDFRSDGKTNAVRETATIVFFVFFASPSSESVDFANAISLALYPSKSQQSADETERR